MCSNMDVKSVDTQGSTNTNVNLRDAAGMMTARTHLSDVIGESVGQATSAGAAVSSASARERKMTRSVTR